MVGPRSKPPGFEVFLDVDDSFTGGLVVDDPAPASADTDGFESDE
jgi:hypothetical protein